MIKLKAIILLCCIMSAAVSANTWSNVSPYSFCSGNHIYRNGVLERVLNDVGYANSTGYHYQVKDYRGDVRAVVAQNGTLEETNSYYLYGMLHGTSAIASPQPYKYTGKELDRENGLDWYDSQARMYMSDLGRTTTMDPLAEKYYSISPYAWCGGNPLRYIDEKGDSLAVLYSPNGANEFGHLAILIQNDDGQWALFSKNGTNSCSGISGPNDKGDNVGFEHFSSVVDFLLSNSNPKDDKGEREYVEAFVIPATNQEDILAIQGAKSELEKDYNLFSSNCAIMVQTALRNAGKDCGEQYNYIPFFDGTKIEYKPYINNLIPHKIYHNILDHNYGTRYYIKKY